MCIRHASGRVQHFRVAKLRFRVCLFFLDLSTICHQTSPNWMFWPEPTRARRDTCTWCPRSCATCCSITASAWRCVLHSDTRRRSELGLMGVTIKRLLACLSDFKNRSNKSRVGSVLGTMHRVLIGLHSVVKLHCVYFSSAQTRHRHIGFTLVHQFIFVARVCVWGC